MGINKSIKSIGGNNRLKLTSVLALLVLLIILIFPFFIEIKKTKCVSQYSICSKQVSEELSQLEGESYKYAIFNINNLVGNIKRVEKYDYYFIFPETLVINVIEKKAVIAIGSKQDGYFLVTKDSFVVDESSETQLPKIYLKNLDFDENSKETKFVVELFIGLTRYYSVYEAIMDKTSLKIVYNDRTEIIFPLEGNVDVLLGSLEVMLFQLNQALQNSKIDNMNASDIKVIDLRFSNPIIK